LRSGLGNGSRRIRSWLYSLFRNLRNGSGTLTPSDFEFFSFYAHVDPSVAQYPPAGPGEEEGTNVNNPMGAFVFGNEGADIFDEESRVSDPPSGGMPFTIGLHVPTKLGDIWQLGKAQRGAVAPDGTAAYPAISAGRSAYWISYSTRSIWGNSYGGFIAAPMLGPACDDPGTGPPPNYQIFFTAKPGSGKPDKVYDGTCEPVPAGEPYPTHIAQLITTPWSWIVILNNGTVDVLSTNDYVQGPYTGSVHLRRATAGHIGRVIHAFCREFRGSDTQRAEPGYHIQESFNFDAFLRAQYFLAPQRGHLDGEGIMSDYRRFYLPVTAGAVRDGATSAVETWEPGYVLTHVYVRAEGMTGTGTVKVLVDGTTAATALLTADADGLGDDIVYVPTLPAGKRVSIQAAGAIVCASLYAEGTELLPWLPQESDQYLVLRATTGHDGNWQDGLGTQESGAKDAWDNYVRYGCILNSYDSPGLFGQLVEVNTNAVFDAARRYSKYVRCVTRNNLLGYGVTNGKSEIYLSRWLTFDGVTVDVLDGIAPAAGAVASGSIAWGVRYVVRSGSIEYAGHGYGAGQPFTGLRGKKDYTGSGAVYEYDGIRATAPQQGETNEWLFEIESKAYWYAEGSPFNPENYADRYALVNRCHFGLDLLLKKDEKWHINYGDRWAVQPDSVDAYNYISGFNASAVENDYRGCRLYETPGEIESATVVTWQGVECIKLVLKNRLYSTYGETGGAPDTVDATDYSDSVVAAIRAEPHRTPENTLREYLALLARGKNCDSSSEIGRRMKPGDYATGTEPASSDTMLGWDIFGACFPTIWLTKLVPKPYDDGNDKPDTHDTRIVHDPMTQLDLYLRAMVEGYIAGRSSVAEACDWLDGWDAYDYTWDSACFEAFGNSWIGPLPDSLRPDQAEGHGPMPTTQLWAEVFNRYSKILNLLDTVRVVLPYKVEEQITTYSDAEPIAGDVGPDCDASNTGCGANGKVAWQGIGPASVTVTNVGPWGDLVQAYTQGQTYVEFSDNCDVDPSKWSLVTNRIVSQFRIALVDPDALYAVPELWRDMIDGYGAVLGVLETLSYSQVAIDGTPPTECFGGDFGGCYLADHYWENSQECVIMRAGTLDGDQPRKAWHTFCKQPGWGKGGYWRQIALTPKATPGWYLKVPIT
jgi:hypothetical protein